MGIRKSKVLLSGILIIVGVLPLILATSVLFLKDPPVWPDEVIFTDMASNLSLSGKLETNLYSGTFSNINRTGLGYPPAYFLILSSWISLWGANIEIVRLLSLTVAFSSLVVFFIMLKHLFKSNVIATFGTFLLSSNIYFSRASRLGRMEILTLLFLLLSVLLLVIAQKSHKSYVYLISGLMAAFAMLSHPMGVITTIIITLGVVLTRHNVREKLTNFLLVASPTLILGSIWLLLSQQDIIALWSTYQTHIQDKAPKLPYALLLFNSDLSWRLLFLAYLTVFFIFLLFYKKSLIQHRLIILIGTIISFSLPFIGKENVYMLYFQPFIIMTFLVILSQKGKQSAAIILAAVIIFSHFFIQFLNNDSIGITGHNNKSVFTSTNYDYHDFTRRIVEKLPTSSPDKTIGVFISATPNPYFDLKKYQHLKFYEAADPYFPISEPAYKNVLDSSDYIIYTWIPHQFLADYINKNTERVSAVSQPDGYSAAVVKLKPKEKRI